MWFEQARRGVCGAPAKRRQQQAGDGSPAMTHSLLLAQEFAMKAGGGGYKLWPVPNVLVGRFMVLAYRLRLAY